MKLSRLFKIGAVALMVTSLCFTGCKEEEDDDEAGMLSGSNNNYSIAYKNESSSVSRGYRTTTFKHAGALCQMTMNQGSEGAGAMGYIWDLESNSSREAKDPRRFFIVGFNYSQTASDKVAYYCSLYKNVTDLQLQNFGATGQKEIGTNDTANGATEKEYIQLNSTNSFTPTINAEGDFVVTVDVYEGGTFTMDAATGKRTYTAYDGTYHVDIYNGKVEQSELAGTTTNTQPVKSITISADDVGYLTETSDTAKSVCEQRQGAVYANVYAGKTLTGSWKYAETYKADEVVEE